MNNNKIQLKKKKKIAFIFLYKSVNISYDVSSEIGMDKLIHYAEMLEKPGFRI